MGHLPEDVSADELREFLAADALEVDADPLFRERLRRKLWAIVEERFGGESLARNGYAPDDYGAGFEDPDPWPSRRDD